MSIVVYPIQAVAGAPLYSARDAREVQSVFLAGATAARPLGARSGVRPGTSTATCSATSTTWTTRAHAGVMDVQTAAEAGPYAYAVNTDQTGAMTAAHATLARIDLLWMRLDDPAESDGTTVPAVVAGYTAGVAATTPAAPATPARCMVLGWVNVPASGGGAPTVSWKAPYTVAAGAPVPVYSQAERDALVAYDGLSVYRLDLHLVETFNSGFGVWQGGAWTNYTPTWFTTSQVGLADQSGRWAASGKTITYQFYVRANAAGNAGMWAISLPVPARSIGILTSLGSATISVGGVYNVATALLIAGGLKVSFIMPGGFGSLATAPAVNNEILASITYEAA